MKLKDFHKQINELTKEIGVTNNPEGHINSHKVIGDISVISDDPTDQYSYEITELELDTLIGCGCPAGIIIHITRTLDP